MRRAPVSTRGACRGSATGLPSGDLRVAVTGLDGLSTGSTRLLATGG
ncbi:hypothetical protein ACWDR0_15620 [Streptomyces sp. NPDC003691]